MQDFSITRVLYTSVQYCGVLVVSCQHSILRNLILCVVCQQWKFPLTVRVLCSCTTTLNILSGNNTMTQAMLSSYFPIQLSIQIEIQQRFQNTLGFKDIMCPFAISEIKIIHIIFHLLLNLSLKPQVQYEYNKCTGVI